VTDRGKRTELHYAARDNDLKLATALVAGGTDVNALDAADCTALHFAASNWAVDVARFLLASGARVDPVNRHGNTPLWDAVFNSRGRGELIELLRAAGANPRHVNTAGQTPVGLARLIANYDVAKFFSDLD
jgi:ankyrin repeat protein